MRDSISGQDLLCPVCRRKIVPFKQLKLETLEEHASDPNGTPTLKWGYWCPDESCATRVFDIFWNDIGELYTQGCAPYLTKEKKASIPFIDNNDAPFGSFERKQNVEISKKDENKILFVFPKFFPSILSEMKVEGRYYYNADFDGNILKRRIKFKYITKEGIIHQWGMKMLIYCIKNNFRAWRELRQNPNAFAHRRELRHSVESAKWQNAEWWRKVSAKIAALLLRFTPSESSVNVKATEFPL